MRDILLRITLALLAALVGVGLIVQGNRQAQEYIRNTLKTRDKLQALQASLYALEGEVLRNGFYLYYSYDRINRLLSKVDKEIQRLKNCPYLRSAPHHRTYRDLEQLEKDFIAYSRNIQHYLTINASLKNSALYIPTLQLRAFDIFDTNRQEDREPLLLLLQIDAAIFLARNAQDTSLLPEIRHYAEQLDTLSKRFDGPRLRLLHTLQSHLYQFLATFPTFVRYFDTLTRTDLIGEIQKISVTYQHESADELVSLKKNTQILLLLYLLALSIVIYFIFRSYHENLRLLRMQKELRKSLVTDPLTGLGNRLAYRKKKSAMHHPALILINIDRFKHINEFYGTSIGNSVLREVAKTIPHIIPDTLVASFFRMGGDDFGILFERGACRLQLISLVKSCHEALLKHEFKVQDLVIDLSFSLGASEKSDWLFETSDMALKASKSSPRERYAVYTPEIDKREEIAKNIQVLRQIHDAIDQHFLVPYFQPILHRKTQRIGKFEALARIEVDGGDLVLQPYNFIHVASEAKLSGEITLGILRKTLEIARTNSFEFSVNISAEDIASDDDRKRILQLLEQHRDLSGRMTFEILESEEIRDYELTAEFIRALKRLGCRIAIDDFGSGYSNFEKILQLDIDILKVDGSLIRNIDRDRESELLVQTILTFARNAGWETVAEYVHSKAVYDKVMALGFDYVQGYYIGKPSRDLNPPCHPGNK